LGKYIQWDFLFGYVVNIKNRSCVRLLFSGYSNFNIRKSLLFEVSQILTAWHNILHHETYLEKSSTC